MKPTVWSDGHHDQHGSVSPRVEDTRLNQALEGVNEAVLLGIRVAQDVCDDIVDGRATEPNPIPSVQRVMYEKAAEARRLAWDLLRTGLDYAAEK